MTSKILAAAGALALATATGLASTAPASARHMHGLVGSALATATMPFSETGYYGYPGAYDPGYAYGYRRYNRHHGYYGYRGYYGYGRYRRCFQTCPER